MNFAPATSKPGKLRLAQAGFTLAEVLAAMLFMAIVIPVALSGLSVASRAGEVAARKSDAALIAERILNENLVTTNWDKTVQNGVARQGQVDFNWSLRAEPWTEDPYQTDMRLLSVEVKFSAQGTECSVRMSTLAQNALTTSTNSLP